MDNNRLKMAAEKALFLLPIIIICAFFIHTWWTNTAPTATAVGLTVAAIIFVATFGSLLTQEIGARGFWIVSRQEKPKLFWAEFITQLLLGLIISIYVLI